MFRNSANPNSNAAARPVGMKEQQQMGKQAGGPARQAQPGFSNNANNTMNNKNTSLNTSMNMQTAGNANNNANAGAPGLGTSIKTT
jgi:hypothetical protein